MRRTVVLVVLCSLAVGACAKGALPPPRGEPALGGLQATIPPIDTPGSKVVRPGTPGALVLFVRGMQKRETRDNARVVADALVSRCEPAFDIIVVFEPGLAALWPGLSKKTAEELVDYRDRRGRCLMDRGLDGSREQVEEQITLVTDDRGEMRRDILEARDPGHDLVLVAYGARGESLFNAGIDDRDRAGEVVAAAEDALRRASKVAARSASLGPP